MKFCQTHWNALRSAIDARGLRPWVAKSGAEAVERVTAGGDAIPEPLIEAHNMILGLAVETFGPALFTQPDGCPVCELLKIAPPIPEGHRYLSNESYLIDGPADAVRDWFVAKGILATS